MADDRNDIETPDAPTQPDSDSQVAGGDGQSPDDLDELLDIAGAESVEGDEQDGDAPAAAADADHEDTAAADADDEDAAADADDEDAADADDEDTAADDEDGGEEEVRLRRPTSVFDCRERKDLLRLSGDFFVVHTYSGYEQRVKDNLESRIEALDAHDRIYEIVIPTDEVTEFKRGKKQTVQKKFLPGYVLVRMEMDDDTWGIVRNTPAVTGFVGPPGTKPVPLSLREVAETLKIPETLEPETQEEKEQPSERQVPEIDLEVGETVRVTTGPFADFTGTIAEINLDQSKLRVMVSVFGRETPLELPFDNVAKL